MNNFADFTLSVRSIADTANNTTRSSLLAWPQFVFPVRHGGCAWRPISTNHRDIFCARLSSGNERQQARPDECSLFGLPLLGTHDGRSRARSMA